jgi:hypothetical protein
MKRYAPASSSSSSSITSLFYKSLGVLACSTITLATLPQERDPVPTVQENGWTTQPVYIGAQNLTPMGFNPP